MTDRKTPYLKLPLPHRDVSREENVERLQNALNDVDGYAARNDAALVALDAELTCKVGTLAAELTCKVETLDADLTCKVGAAQSTAQSAVADAAAARRAADEAKAESAVTRRTADEAKAESAATRRTADEAKAESAVTRRTADEAKAESAAARRTADEAKAVTDTVSVSPTPGGIPRAGADGKIDAGWLPAVHALCEFYYFRHPTLKPGFQLAQGGVISNAATAYPEAWAYLQTAEGRLLCRTEAEWQAMTVATWATLADGTKVGWGGIGGAPFYVQNLAAGTLRLPDLRGMYAEAAGFDALEVGGVHGDGVRDIHGSAANLCPIRNIGAPGGAVYWHNTSTATLATPLPGSSGEGGFSFASRRVVPTANKNQPRAWGALACVYLGRPAS